MKADITKAQLFKWLKSQDEGLAARVLHIREELSKWLPQVPQFFRHYPSHGLDHSDRIVGQLSRLLFNKTKPVVKFSPAEVYCLLCAAYLHDIGMVVSPGDASTILASDSWNAFVVSGGSGHENYQKYVQLRDGPAQVTKELTAFLADQSLRLLIADFVRRDHHERGKTTLLLHPYLRQLVDDGDSVAFETIADLGVGHGLRDSDLADANLFPEQRDVFDGKVNVRFLAHLLRIGDLLDMSSKRADPMTARAVGPLPSDAVPHWQQYSTKKHENITPQAIEFRFECKDQDTHRVLRDWFGWLEAEVRAAGLEQMHSARHSGWKAPKCIVSSQATADARSGQLQPTIVIKPAPEARYTFHDWRLELDQEQVLQRLIHDVYDDPTVFVRELIQNALDATRCQMFADFAVKNSGLAPPERPTQFSAEVRERYPVSISFAHEDVRLSLDGPVEKRPVITVEDRGTGMNEEIIRRYFLQVGRSYYQSNEFRERFKFAPTSRFGIGFLSVFAVSKDITVDTARRDETTGAVKGIRLRLREPRNYLLTEPWVPFEERSGGASTGTRIRIVLGDWPVEVSLGDLVRRWCVAVEFPVLVKEDGNETIIRSERLIDKTVLAPSRVNPEARFVLRSFGINSVGVEGEVAVIAYEDAEGEGWCDCWSMEADLAGARLDQLPKVNKGYTALHGVRLSNPPEDHERYRSERWAQRCDVRSGVATVPLARSVSSGRLGVVNRFRRHGGGPPDAVDLGAIAADATMRAAVELHLTTSQRAKGPRAVYYIGQVISDLPFWNAWQDHIPGTVVTWQNGRRVDISVAALLELDEIIIAAWEPPTISWRYIRTPLPPMRQHPREVSLGVPVISCSDIPDLSDRRLGEKLAGMNLVEVKTSEDLCLFHFSATCSNSAFSRVEMKDTERYLGWEGTGNPGRRGSVYFEIGMSRSLHILDRNHPVIRWLCFLREQAKTIPDIVGPEQVEAIWGKAVRSPYDMSTILDTWAESQTLPPELKPPRNDKGELLSFDYEELVSRRTVALD